MALCELQKLTVSASNAVSQTVLRRRARGLDAGCLERIVIPTNAALTETAVLFEK